MYERNGWRRRNTAGQHWQKHAGICVTQIIRKATSKKTTKTLMMLPGSVWVSATEASGMTGTLLAGLGTRWPPSKEKAEPSESAAHF